jgi:hypothetical protein
MDQAASADQVILRDFRERGQDADLDRDIRLRSYRAYQKTIGVKAGPLHYFTNFEYKRI